VAGGAAGGAGGGHRWQSCGGSVRDPAREQPARLTKELEHEGKAGIVVRYGRQDW
jgi:hypothetical protein